MPVNRGAPEAKRVESSSHRLWLCVGSRPALLACTPTSLWCPWTHFGRLLQGFQCWPGRMARPCTPVLGPHLGPLSRGSFGPSPGEWQRRVSHPGISHKGFNFGFLKCYLQRYANKTKSRKWSSALSFCQTLVPCPWILKINPAIIFVRWLHCLVCVFSFTCVTSLNLLNVNF